MILLQHLHVRALKQLYDVDIWFPRRGSVLIEGRNESGKSTLFEAIYFALYGAPLVGEETRATLDDLIPHDGTPVQVDLTLTTQEATLEIRRRLFPASNTARRVTHEARLRVRRAGLPLEEINGPSAVNARILQEMNGLDGEALRNSCFMEQKALDRVERLSRDQRDTAVARLIGIERLRRIEKELREAASTEERALARLREEYEVAELRQSAIAAEMLARVVEEQVRATWARLRLEERDSRNTGIAAQQEQLAELIATRDQLSDQIAMLAQVQTLREAMDAADARLDEAAAAQHTYAEAAAQVDELARVEHETLPPVNARLAALGTLETDLRAAESLRKMLGLLEEAAAAETAVTAAQMAMSEAERSYASAHAATARATLRGTFTRWLQLKELQALVAGNRETEAQQATLAAQRAALDAQINAGQAAAGRWQRLALIAAALAVMALVAGLKFGPLWGLAALFALGAGYCWWSAEHQRRLVQTREEQRAGVVAQLAALQAQIETARRLTGSFAELPRIEEQLRAAGLDVSSRESVETARATLAAPGEEDGEDDNEAAILQQREHEAQQATLRQQAQLVAAQAQAMRAQEAIRSAGVMASMASIADTGDFQQRLATLREALRQQEVAIAEQCAALAVPAEQNAVAAARGAAEAERQALDERLRMQPTLLAAAQEQAEQARQTLVLAWETLYDLQQRMWQAGLEGGDSAAMTTSDAPIAGDALSALMALREQLAQTLAAHHNPAVEQQAYAELATVDERLRARAQQEEGDAAICEQLHEQIAGLLSGAGIAYNGSESFDTLVSRWPALAQVDSAQLDEYEAAYKEASQEAHHLLQSAEERAQAYGLAEAELDVVACGERLATGKRTHQRYLLAAEMAQQVRGRIVRRILPETQAHMRALLPELTAGRYRDVQLLAEDTNNQNADLKIRLWDEVAGRLVGKDIFSGGTRDQCSLALRLAFALATLPKELGAMPGFIFLDEPLSSFDAERSQALVRILTQGVIAEQFDQVLLISHSQSFDPESFRYYVRMENGRIAESSLPEARLAENLWRNEEAMVGSLAGG